MKNIEVLIIGSEKLTEIFGYWPSFHDAEILEIQFWRGEVEPEIGRYVFPVLTARLHHWELAKEPKSDFLTTRHHTLTTLRFHDVDEFRMEGFNHQNAILELSITQQHRDAGPSPVFKVHFDPAHGMGATFICSRIEVVEATQCSDDGKLS